MKKIILFILILALNSCIGYKTTTSIGNYNQPVIVKKSPYKEGRSCYHFVFPFSLYKLYDNFDYSIERVRISANIKEIISIEYQETIIGFYLFRKKCMIVRGN